LQSTVVVVAVRVVVVVAVTVVVVVSVFVLVFVVTDEKSQIPHRSLQLSRNVSYEQVTRACRVRNHEPTCVNARISSAPQQAPQSEVGLQHAC
jgi:hypothetical protein